MIKVGQKILINPDCKDFNNIPGNPGFIDEMFPWLGVPMTVKRLIGNWQFKVEENGWSWDVRWIIDQNDYKSVTEEEFMKIFG